MQTGIDTVKPDQRVKDALSDLGISFRNDLEVIQICEKMAGELGFRPKEFDFILWYSREEARSDS
jgi:thermostable 8-oxoguanine DNA glycosylase